VLCSYDAHEQQRSIEVQDYVSHVIMVSGLVKTDQNNTSRSNPSPSLSLTPNLCLRQSGDRSNVTFTVDLVCRHESVCTPADVITLNRTQRNFYVSGEVKRLARKFRRGLTLTQAIITAGGAIGVPREVRVGRDDGKGFLVVTRYQLKDIGGNLQDP
jgi:protein involved in polysaccharide export with SLBB domain